MRMVTFLDVNGQVIPDDAEDPQYAYVFPDSLDATVAYDPDGTVATQPTNFRAVMIDHDLDDKTDMILFVALTDNADGLETDNNDDPTPVMFSTSDADGMV